MDEIDKEIVEVFKKLSKTKPNVSFVYSYIYATSKDPGKAKINGRLNMLGSLEEVEIHMEELTDRIRKEAKKQEARKDKIYGDKKS